MSKSFIKTFRENIITEFRNSIDNIDYLLSNLQSIIIQFKNLQQFADSFNFVNNEMTLHVRKNEFEIDEADFHLIELDSKHHFSHTKVTEIRGTRSSYIIGSTIIFRNYGLSISVVNSPKSFLEEDCVYVELRHADTFGPLTSNLIKCCMIHGDIVNMQLKSIELQ